jgi:hypothetical protein
MLVGFAPRDVTVTAVANQAMLQCQQSNFMLYAMPAYPVCAAAA